MCRYLDEDFIGPRPEAVPLAFFKARFSSRPLEVALWLVISRGLNLRAIDAIEVSASFVPRNEARYLKNMLLGQRKKGNINYNPIQFNSIRRVHRRGINI